jgi:hypothetical protein
MHAALDIRAAAVIPALLGSIALQDDEELARARERGARNVQYLIDAAHQDGTLRPDVTFGDIGTLIVRLSRPLPGAFPPDQNSALAHRHLDLLVDGLRATAVARAPLPGPALSRDDLQRLPQQPPAEEESAS